MAALTSDVQEDLMIRACNIRKRYNKLRHELLKKMEQYYRQDITSSYYKESDLKAALDECEKLKLEYIKVRDMLLENGVKPVSLGGWTAEGHNELFAKI